MNDFCLKQSQGFKASAAHLHQNFLRVLPRLFPRGRPLAWDNGITDRSTSSSSPRPFSPLRNHHVFRTHGTRPGAVGERVLSDLFSNQREWTLSAKAQLFKGFFLLTQG